MATYKVPIEGAVYVKAESVQAAQEKVEHWFQMFPPVEEKTGVLTHQMAAGEPEEADPRQLPPAPEGIAAE